MHRRIRRDKRIGQHSKSQLEEAKETEETLKR